MSRILRTLLPLALLLTAHCGDDDSPAPVSSPDAGETCEACLNDFGKNDKKLCPEPQADWNCIEGCCVPVFACETDEQCATLGFDEGHCTDERYDCRCEIESGLCYEWLCGTSDECDDGEVCDAGACVAISDSLELRLVNHVPILSPGAEGQLLAEAYDPSSPELGLPVEVTWHTEDADVVSVDAEGVVTGGDTAGNTWVGAQLGEDDSTRVTLDIRNIIPAVDATLTVAALYERSLDVPTGRYALVSSADGALIEAADIPADGVISTTADISGGCDVHMLAEKGDWVSWLGATDGVLFLPIPRTAYAELSMDDELGLIEDETSLDNVNVLRGTVDFGDYDKEGELELTLSSFAFSSGLFDFSLETLLGPNVKRFFDPGHSIPGVGDTDTAEIPGGITFSLGTPAIPQFHLTPSKGTHRVWTLGGRITLDQVAPVADQLFGAFSGEGLDFGLLVGTLFPTFNDFWSGVATTDTVAGDAQMSIMPLEVTLAVPLGLHAQISTGLVPTLGELGTADAVFVLAGAMTPDQLFMPIGITADTDSKDPDLDPPDRRVDADDTTEAIEPLSLPYAPLHSGLGGPHGRYAMAVVAAAIIGENDPRPDAGSAILVRYEPGEEPPNAIQFPDFLDFPMESSWSPEERLVTASSVDGAAVQRILFKHSAGRHWTVWLNGRTEYQMPTPSNFAADGDTLEDRTASVSLVLINSFDLSDDVTTSSLSAPGGINLDGLLDAVDRTSFMDIRP